MPETRLLSVGDRQYLIYESDEGLRVYVTNNDQMWDRARTLPHAFADYGRPVMVWDDDLGIWKTWKAD